MLSERSYTTIISPVISEKSAIQKTNSNTYVFKVAKDADKQEINSSIEDERFLKFKISTETLLLIVEGKKHPEDLLFSEKVKISGDISILAP